MNPTMSVKNTTPQELWSRQRISSLDVDYDFWNAKREVIQSFAQMSKSCIFTVDVFKGRYDFASDNFSQLFGYDPQCISNIRQEGDLLEERIHPDDRAQLLDYQVEHGQFIYSLSPEYRNDYRQIFQMRMLNARGQYVNVVSRQQVLEQDKNGKAWIVMGIMDIAPDQLLTDRVKRTVVNRRTGEVLAIDSTGVYQRLTNREREVLLFIREGLLSKEIACKLNISIHTVNNHRKNILEKLNADHVMEAVNTARRLGII